MSGCREVLIFQRQDDLSAIVKTVMELSKIDRFKKSVRDIRGFKVESWSDFTALVKNA